jgi:hypothetical protein
MAFTIPAVKQSMAPPDASIHVNVLSTKLDHISYGPKFLNTSGATIFVTNNRLSFWCDQRPFDRR